MVVYVETSNSPTVVSFDDDEPVLPLVYLYTLRLEDHIIYFKGNRIPPKSSKIAVARYMFGICGDTSLPRSLPRPSPE